MEFVRNHLEVITKQNIIHCIIDNVLCLHLVKYTKRFILQTGKQEENMSIQIICKYLTFLKVQNIRSECKGIFI